MSRNLFRPGSVPWALPPEPLSFFERNHGYLLGSPTNMLRVVGLTTVDAAAPSTIAPYAFDRTSIWFYRRRPWWSWQIVAIPTWRTGMMTTYTRFVQSLTQGTPVRYLLLGNIWGIVCEASRRWSMIVVWIICHTVHDAPCFLATSLWRGRL